MLKYQKQTCTLPAGKNKGEKRAYATLKATGTCDFPQLVEHISQKYGLNTGDCYRFMGAFADGIYDQLVRGNTVELAWLGRFHLTLRSEACKAEDFDTHQIKEINLRFNPNKKMKQKLREIQLKPR